MSTHSFTCSSLSRTTMKAGVKLHVKHLTGIRHSKDSLLWQLMITVIFFELVKNLPWILLILCLFSCYLKSTSLLTKYEIKVSIIAMAQIQTDQKLWQLLLKLFDFSDASVQVFFLVNSTVKHALSNFYSSFINTMSHTFQLFQKLHIVYTHRTFDFWICLFLN